MGCFLDYDGGGLLWKNNVNDALHSAPCTLHPAPCTLQPLPSTLRHSTFLHPTLYVMANR